MQTGLSLTVAAKKKKELPQDVLDYFREEGRKGGKKGAKKLAETMTPEQRSERAQKAARARWKKAAAKKNRASES